MGQESSQVQQIEEDPSIMDGNSSTRGGVEGDYPLPALPPPSRDARERSSSSPQLKRKISNGISEDGAGDQSDSARRADKKLKKLLKKKSKDSIGGKGDGKSSDGTISMKHKKKKNRSSDAVARRSSQSGPLQALQNIGRSAAAVLLPRSDTVDRVPESSHPTVDAPSSSTAAKKRKRKSKANRQSLQEDAAGNGDNAGDGGSGLKAADAEPLGKEKDKTSAAAAQSSWAAVNAPPHTATPAKSTQYDTNTTNGQSKDKDADEEVTEEPARADVLASINTIVRINKRATPRESESGSLGKQTEANAVKPNSSQARPVEDKMDLDPTQFQTTPPDTVDNAMDLTVVEPLNKDANPTEDGVTAQERLDVTNNEVPQIGVYAADDEQPPSTTRRRKRRLPVDDDPVETPSKKTKRALKAKSPVTKGQKTAAAAKAPGGSSLTPQTPTRKAATNDGNQPGKMTDEDLAVIKNQLLKYREMNDITVVEQNRLIHGKASEHAELFNMVCEEFPDRKRWSIIKFCRRKFHNFPARGKWTPEDDEELNEAYRQMPRKWTLIGQRLNRHPEDCRDRWRNYLICGDNMVTVYWTPEEEQRLRDIVADCVSHLQEMKDLGMIVATPEQEAQGLVGLVDWQSVSEKMGRTRSRLQCLGKWGRMHETEDADDYDATPHTTRRSWREAAARKETQRMDLDDKLMLLRSIQESQVAREGKVQWRNLGSEEFRDRFDTRVLKLAFAKLKAVVPGPIPTDLQETVQILLNKLENANGQDPTEEAFRDPKKKKYLSKETIGSDEEEDEDDNIQSQIMQELPKLKNTPRSAEKKKLSDRMARRSESIDSVGNAVPSGGPEVPESDYDDEPAASKTNGKKTNGNHKASKSDSSSSSDSDSDQDEEIPARRASISL